MFPSGQQAVCEKLANEWEVSPEIHPNDFIFHFLWNSPVFETKEKSLEYYFDDGQKSAQKLRGLLENICGFKDASCDLLEFASGYGCVTRHYKKVMPSCKVTACDIHPAAMQFIEDKLGTGTVLSSHAPEDLTLEPRFDVVFALSFFSHLPKTTFQRWLKQLAALAKPDGYLIFTTHGLVTRRKSHPDYPMDPDGFFFMAGSEQKDLDEQEYGVNFASPKYVFNQILQTPNLIPVFFQEGYWWEHQDTYIVKCTGPDIPSPKSGIPLAASAAGKRFFSPRFKGKVKSFIKAGLNLFRP